ncbi:hypothetical protein KL86CLO1_10812 [uncultured Eubacteriales bacterium]|uniref:Uncharacterized protein n=1 Tax=uncultured Eubacteriales bacterium TaxID=172733 RepID=A0A212JB44_9FIRM|nr:hypothetical protein KL86CLO1_10812 [uncultured Eubacteriales bacterium]
MNITDTLFTVALADIVQTLTNIPNTLTDVTDTFADVSQAFTAYPTTNVS